MCINLDIIVQLLGAETERKSSAEGRLLVHRGWESMPGLLSAEGVHSSAGWAENLTN